MESVSAESGSLAKPLGDVAPVDADCVTVVQRGQGPVLWLLQLINIHELEAVKVPGPTERQDRHSCIYPERTGKSKHVAPGT